MPRGVPLAIPLRSPTAFRALSSDDEPDLWRRDYTGDIELWIDLGQPDESRLRKACGTGGTVKEGRIEIQGDQRETVARILAEAGFRPVFAGG